MNLDSPRAIDHLVLPTGGLDVARARLTALGFTVAPDALHPFGTGNCCVYFRDGTYLEPLAVVDDRTARESWYQGNTFTRRDAAFRFRRGEEGFSALAFATDDAAADHQAFIEIGMSGGSVLEFSRPFVDAAGKSNTATFRLAFLQDFRAPDAFFFTCQRLNAPNVDRSALQAHANGVTGIRSVVLSAPHATAYADFVLMAVDAPMTEEEGGSYTTVRARNGVVRLYEQRVMQREFGASTRAEPGLEFRAVVFGVSDLKGTEQLLKSHKVKFEPRGARLVVHPAPGQGAIFAFEEIQ